MQQSTHMPMNNPTTTIQVQYSNYGMPAPLGMAREEYYSNCSTPITFSRDIPHSNRSTPVPEEQSYTDTPSMDSVEVHQCGNESPGHKLSSPITNPHKIVLPEIDYKKLS